jgi:pimeloyl-ACP methyl ester carboxylesterase
MKLFISVIFMAVSFAATGQQGQTDVITSPDGNSIVYEVHGEGTPALVFVHGWSCDRSYWHEQLEVFSQQFKVVAMDLAGHGESGLERESWTMAAFGGDVAAVVEKLGLQNIILIGHSMGGDVIAEAALRLPDRVASLIMIDTYKKLGTGRTPEEVQSFVALLRNNFPDSTRSLVRGMFLPNSDSSLVERVAADMSSAPQDIALGALEHALNYSRQMPVTLEKLKLPVIAINPDNAPTDFTSMERYGIEVVIMPGVGHFLIMEDPGGFNQLLMTTIDKFDR